MAFFRNSTVNLLNLHYGIHAIALTGGGAFFSAYLLKSGVSVPGTLLFFALVLLGRFIARPFMVGFAARFGMRRLVAAGTLLSAVQYPFLSGVHGVGAMLACLVVVSSLADLLDRPSYHAYFAALGDHEHRGQQIGVREAIAAIVGVVSPLALGLAARRVRSAGCVQRYRRDRRAGRAAAPLDARRAGRACGARCDPRGVTGRADLHDRWLGGGGLCVRVADRAVPVVGRELPCFGGALAIAALVGVDQRHAGRALHRCRAWVARRGARLWADLRHRGDPSAGAARCGARGDGECAQRGRRLSLYPHSDDRRLQSGQERALHLALPCGDGGRLGRGGAAGLLTSAGLLALGLPMWSAVLTSLVGLAAGFVMIRRYYAANPGLTPEPLDPPIEKRGRRALSIP